MIRAPEARLRTAAYWLIPSLVCLLLHWRGFRAWFRADDFAWLGAGLDVHNFGDLLRLLFGPAAQGTIRPWSEPAFFVAGYTLFGLNPLPFRIVIFATQFVNLALVAAIGARLTGSRAAGLCAALLWVMNGSLVEPLGWTCTYNQVMCGCFLLGAFYFLLRHIETGERRYYVYQWIVFLLGFGALETNVVYPVLAGGYTFLCARKYFRRTLPLAAVSAAYAIVHLIVAPGPKTGEYVMHFTGSMLRTLARYWTWSVGPTYLYSPFRLPGWVLPAGIAAVTLGLGAFTVRRTLGYRAGESPAPPSGTALFCLLWYVAVIAPVLPLRDHVTEYYVFLPVIGLCWLGGWAVAEAWRSGTKTALLATALAAIYAFMGVPEAVAGAKWNYQLTMRARSVVEGVKRAHELHPQQAILLDGVDNDLFWNGVLDRPFRLVGADRVYLAPGSRKRIVGEDAASFELRADATAHALARGELVVYDARGPRLRNITGVYAGLPQEARAPTVVDAANPLDAYLLGPEWYELDEDHRWMPKRATLRIAGPDRPGERLHLRGGTTGDLLSEGPVTVNVAVDGAPLPAETLGTGKEEFDFSLPLPDTLLGKPQVNVTIEVSRTFQARSDPRQLGLHFGVFEVK